MAPSGRQGLVGGQWRPNIQESRAFLTMEEGQEILRQGDDDVGAKAVFHRQNLASQVLDIGIKRADVKGPTLTCCFIPKADWPWLS